MSLAATRFLRGRLQPGQTDDAMDDGAPGGNDDPQLEDALRRLTQLIAEPDPAAGRSK